MTKGGSGGRMSNDRVRWVSVRLYPTISINVNWPRLLPSAEAKIYQERGGKTKHEKSNEEV